MSGGGFASQNVLDILRLNAFYCENDDMTC